MEQSKNVSFPTGRLGGTRAWYKEGSEAPPPPPPFQIRSPSNSGFKVPPFSLSIVTMIS